ncbi:MAG: ribosomal protein S18-alanine N-acetyltransferase [Bdellovibrionales bacterium]|nr:ribosomal protein S18-alanine N-acetyltransferase [Bdellovibrionales bacterium]
MEAVSLRRATEDDLEGLAALEQRCQPAPWTREQFQAEFLKPYSQVILLTDDETDERILGYIVFWVVFDETQILNVAVEPDARGLGYGRRLVAAAVKAALRAQSKRVTLDVRVGNLGAIALYERCKFVKSHVRKAFYSDGEDGIQMDLFLGEGRVLPDFLN